MENNSMQFKLIVEPQPYNDQKAAELATMTVNEANRVIGKYTIEALNFVMKAFPNIPLTDMPVIRFNRRMKCASGWFVPTKNLIELSMIDATLDERLGTEHLMNTLNHELVHFGLWYQGLPYDDGSETFETMLGRFGVESSSATPEYLRGGTKNSCMELEDIYRVYDKKTKKYMGGFSKRHSVKESYPDNRKWSVDGIPVSITRTGYRVIEIFD